MADPRESVLEFLRQLPSSAASLDRGDVPWQLRHLLDPEMPDRVSFKVRSVFRGTVLCTSVWQTISELVMRLGTPTLMRPSDQNPPNL